MITRTQLEPLKLSFLLKGLNKLVKTASFKSISNKEQMHYSAYAAYLYRCELESTESEDQFCLPLPPDIQTCRCPESLPLIR